MSYVSAALAFFKLVSMLVNLAAKWQEEQRAAGERESGRAEALTEVINDAVSMLNRAKEARRVADERIASGGLRDHDEFERKD